MAMVRPVRSGAVSRVHLESLLYLEIDHWRSHRRCCYVWLVNDRRQKIGLVIGRGVHTRDHWNRVVHSQIFILASQQLDDFLQSTHALRKDSLFIVETTVLRLQVIASGSKCRPFFCGIRLSDWNVERNEEPDDRGLEAVESRLSTE